MKKNTFSWDLFHEMPVIGIMRNISYSFANDIGRCYQKSGLRNLEVTMNSVDAEKTITALNESYGASLNIGAGTVCNANDLERALKAGATFVVTPILDEEVVSTCVKEHVPVFPGAFTPTEIYRAWSLGANMIKVFPASKLGPGYIKEVLAPLNQVKLLPTGGITSDNFVDYLKAGARGVGVGSELFPRQLIENKDWSKWEDLLSSFVQKYQLYLSDVEK